jgi:pyridoxal phosphate enzyme (YggS family)
MPSNAVRHSKPGSRVLAGVLRCHRMGKIETSAASIRENLAIVRERIVAAAHQAERGADEITLIAVSKTHPAEAIRAAYQSGLRHFGENRIQEWEGKRSGVQDIGASWHLIGHLQSNKAARAAAMFDTIDSVDDFALAQRLDRARAAIPESTKLRVLLEVRVAPEETKSGVEARDAERLAEQIAELPHLELAGLMCIPPFLQDLEKVRPYFVRLRELRDTVARRLGRALPVLSMGMSHDFAVAIEEGATEVRIGTAIFGERPRQ